MQRTNGVEKEELMQHKANRLAFAVIAGVLGLFVGVASAQQAASKSTTTEVKKFTVIAVDGNQLVVRLPEGTREITVPDDFKFTVNGQSMSVHELKPGMAGTATITTTTTVKPVTVTEIKSGTVDKVMGSTVIVRTAEGFRMFTEADMAARNVKIIKDGKPIVLSELHAGDRLSATIITEKPPQIMTEKQVNATLAAANPGGGAAGGATAKSAAPAAKAAPSPSPAPAPAAASSSGARTLPKTASPLPLFGLLGVLSLAMAVTLRASRRRHTTE
jgi:hypothetical protein